MGLRRLYAPARAARVGRRRMFGRAQDGVTGLRR